MRDADVAAFIMPSKEMTHSPRFFSEMRYSQDVDFSGFAMGMWSGLLSGGARYSFGQHRVDAIQYHTIIGTLGKITSLIAAFARAFYQIPDFKIEPIVESGIFWCNVH